MLGYVRRHWEIENRLHYVRDVTLEEDSSRVRKGAGPQVMVLLRNITLGLLRRGGFTNIAAAGLAARRSLAHHRIAQLLKIERPWVEGSVSF